MLFKYVTNIRTLVRIRGYLLTGIRIRIRIRGFRILTSDPSLEDIINYKISQNTHITKQLFPVKLKY